jgi:hypothetical protein
MKKEPMVALFVRIPESDHKALKQIAEFYRSEMSPIIRPYIKQGIIAESKKITTMIADSQKSDIIK